MILLDILLLIMITICIGYCYILNKRIRNLHNSRVEFARMIKELNISIVKAENNINRMSELSKVTSAEIQSSVNEAQSLSTELADMHESVDYLLSKMLGQ